MYEWKASEQIKTLTSEQCEENPIEKNNQAEIEKLKTKLMDLFDLSDSMDALNAMAQNDEIIGSASKYLETIALSEQEELAEDFFNKTIGENIENRTKANMVSELFSGTPFAEKFRELANKSV